MSQNPQSKQKNSFLFLILKPKKMCQLKLPTEADAIQSILFEKSEKSKISSVQIIKNVAEKIEQIWLQTMIPVICRRAIEYRLKTLESRYSSLLKSKYGKNSQYFDSMVQKFNAETSNNLFVISLCTCKEINDCKCRRNCKIH